MKWRREDEHRVRPPRSLRALQTILEPLGKADLNHIGPHRGAGRSRPPRSKRPRQALGQGSAAEGLLRTSARQGGSSHDASR